MRPTIRPFAAALGVLLVLSTVACSPDDDAAPEPEQTEAADLDRFATTDVAELLRAGPGRLDLESDRDEIVAQVRAAHDDGVRGDELFHTLLNLGAADFREYQEFLDTFEMEFTDPGRRPDGSVEGPGEVEPFLNVQVLFDASGSMRGSVDGRPKIDLAKEAVDEFVQRLPEGVNVSLRAYGHLGSNREEDKAESCGTTEDVYPFGAYDETRFSAALESFSPTGFTPIGRAIEDAAADLAALDGELPSAVYVVSDGEETCDGDPVAAARDLVSDDVQAVVNIIGFDVADAEARALRAIATAGNGEYLGANSAADLRRALRAQRDELRAQWARWRDESRAIIASERDTTRADVAERRDESRALAADEREALLSIVDDLDLENADRLPLRSAVQSRGTGIRSHLFTEFTGIRSEVFLEGTQRRVEIWEEGTRERQRLWEESLSY